MIKREEMKPALSEPRRKDLFKSSNTRTNTSHFSHRTGSVGEKEVHPGLGLTSNFPTSSSFEYQWSVLCFHQQKADRQRVADPMDHPPKPLRATSPLPPFPP